MSSPTTCEASRNAIGSPASADGPTPSGLPDGPTTDLLGQALVHASHSAQPEKAQAKKMQRGTFGLRGNGSSASASLQRSLGSKLAQRLATAGSTMFSYRLSNPTTPAGRQYFQLAASGHRISEAGCTSWPTASAQDTRVYSEDSIARYAIGESVGGHNLDLNAASQLASWPTPNTPSGGRSVGIEKMSSTGMTTDGRKHTVSLEHVAKFAGWPTPMAGTPAQNGNNEAGNTDSSRKMVALCSWATPRAEDSESTGAHRRTPDTLTSQSRLSSWATPRALAFEEDLDSFKKRNEVIAVAPKYHGASGIPLAVQAQLTASGQTPNGSPAETGKAGQLNPELPRWLMGLPPEWSSCADTAMALLRLRPKRSSERT